MLVSVTYYISLCVGAKLVFETSLQDGRDNFQQMCDFDSCQLNLIRMAYTTDRLVSIFVQAVMWHLTSPYM